MILLLFLCALSLSGTAAFYSIIGLMAIFAASPMPIAIMGSLLEGSKLVIASWLYRNWKDIPRLFKGYFTVALFILMFLTSMGIFGFLSKAHIEQGVPSDNIAAEVNLIDEKIKTEKENIDAARKTLNQLDQQVDQTISRTTDANGTDRSVAIRRSQARERSAATKLIAESQKRLAQLSEERAPKAAQLRKVEAEVGPIKYIAALIYGEEAGTDQTLLEKSVRWVIILIVAVFDPLAVTMLMAANWSQMNIGRKKKEEVSEEPPSSPPTVQEDPPTKVEPTVPPFADLQVQPPTQEDRVVEKQLAEELVKLQEETPNEHPVFAGKENVWRPSTWKPWHDDHIPT